MVLIGMRAKGGESGSKVFGEVVNCEYVGNHVAGSRRFGGAAARA